MVHTERQGVKRAGAGLRVGPTAGEASAAVPSPFFRRLCCSEPQLPHLQNGAVVLTWPGLWRLAADPGSKALVCTKANRGGEVRLGGPDCDFFYLKTVPEVEKKKAFLRSTKPRVIKQNYVTGLLGILSVLGSFLKNKMANNPAPCPQRTEGPSGCRRPGRLPRAHGPGIHVEDLPAVVLWG